MTNLPPPSDSPQMPQPAEPPTSYLSPTPEPQRAYEPPQAYEPRPAYEPPQAYEPRPAYEQQSGYGQLPSVPVSGYGQPASGPPGYGQPYGQPIMVSQPTNGLAIAAMIVAIVGFGPIGAIMGHIARRQIRERNEQGDGFALAGIIVGWVTTGFWVLCCGGYALIVAGMFGSAAVGGAG